MAASNTPRPPGEWLAKPNRVAETKITATTIKPRLGSSGTSTYIASAQKPRSTMPIAICSKVSDPPGRITVQGPRRAPGHIDPQRQDGGERGEPVQPGRKLIDRGSGFRMIGDAKAQYRGI